MGGRIIILMLCTVSVYADLFFAIPADASKEEFDALNKLINEKIGVEKIYDIKTMGKKLEKDKVVYLCCNYDVDGRGFEWNVEKAKEDIKKEEAKTPTLTNVVVEVKQSEEFKTEVKAVEEPIKEEPK